MRVPLLYSYVIKYFDSQITLLPVSSSIIHEFNQVTAIFFIYFLQLGAVHKRTRVIQIVWRLAIHTFACVSQSEWARKIYSFPTYFRSCFVIQEQQQCFGDTYKQGWSFWRRGESKRSFLFCSGSSVSSQLYIKVQGHSSGSAKTPLAAWVPKRLLARWGVKKVRRPSVLFPLFLL